MPDEHQASRDIASSSCQGSRGIKLAWGKLRAIQVLIATFSVSFRPSTMSSGTLCLGFRLRYSGDLCSPFLKLIWRVSNLAQASVSVTYGTSEQAMGEK